MPRPTPTSRNKETVHGPTWIDMEDRACIGVFPSLSGIDLINSDSHERAVSKRCS